VQRIGPSAALPRPSDPRTGIRRVAVDGPRDGYECDLGLFLQELGHALERALGNLRAVDGDQDPGRHAKQVLPAAALKEVRLSGEMKRTIEERQPWAQQVERTGSLMSSWTDARASRSEREDPLTLRDRFGLAACRRSLKQIERLVARTRLQCGDEHDALHVRRVYDEPRKAVEVSPPHARAARLAATSSRGDNARRSKNERPTRSEGRERANVVKETP
jgi:hypothetical protein